MRCRDKGERRCNSAVPSSVFINSTKGIEMLLLSRKVGEQIVLTVGDEEIIVHLSRINGSRARIGIEASKNVKVRRRELDERND